MSAGLPTKKQTNPRSLANLQPANRWVKGQSGNPSGVGKWTAEKWTAVALAETVSVQGPDGPTLQQHGQYIYGSAVRHTTWFMNYLDKLHRGTIKEHEVLDPRMLQAHVAIMLMVDKLAPHTPAGVEEAASVELIVRTEAGALFAASLKHKVTVGERLGTAQILAAFREAREAYEEEEDEDEIR